MTKRDRARQERRVTDCVKKWCTLLGMNGWKIYLDFPEEYPQTIPGSSLRSIMNVTTQWEYLLVTIRVDLEAILNQSDEQLDGYVVHELMHVFLAEMEDADDSDEGIRHEERVATMLASSITHLCGTLEERFQKQVRRHGATAT